MIRELDQRAALRLLLNWLDTHEVAIVAEAEKLDLTPEKVMANLLDSLVPGGQEEITYIGGVLTAPGLRLEPSSRRVYLKGKQIHLPNKQFELLAYLMKNRGDVVSKDEIAKNVWKDVWFRNNKTIPIHIGALRQSLGDYEAITTVRGVGYRFDGVRS
jgi:DNA-binding response OmpR family regulator